MKKISYAGVVMILLLGVAGQTRGADSGKGKMYALDMSNCAGFAAASAADRAAESKREPLAFTYIANSGVMLASGETKVLIDALFDQRIPDYRAPAPEVLEKIEKGMAPFAGVDLALVTHNHPDHFSSRLAVRFLEANPGAWLMAPPDAAAQMQADAADWTKIAPRVVSPGIEVGGMARRDLRRISVTAMRTLHSGGRESPLNFMYFVELGGWRVFHEGDSTGKPGDFSVFRLGETPVDLALVHFWFPLDPNCAPFLQEILRPEHIGLTHLPIRLEGNAPGKIDQVRKHYRDIFLLLPEMPVKLFR